MSSAAASLLAWTGAATTMVAGLSLLGTGLLAQSRAATAADLASLAAADAVAVAHPHPCGLAAEVATRNGARLVLCEQRDWDVLVTVEVDASPLPGAEARSRAGPGTGTDTPGVDTDAEAGTGNGTGPVAGSAPAQGSSTSSRVTA